jgi:hypothetical protein
MTDHSRKQASTPIDEEDGRLARQEENAAMRNPQRIESICKQPNTTSSTTIPQLGPSVGAEILLRPSSHSSLLLVPLAALLRRPPAGLACECHIYKSKVKTNVLSFPLFLP